LGVSVLVTGVQTCALPIYKILKIADLVVLSSRLFALHF
jgi:hypothetical protein